MPAIVNPLVKVYQDRIDKLELDSRQKLRTLARTIAAIGADLAATIFTRVEHYSSLIARNDPVRGAAVVHGARRSGRGIRDRRWVITRWSSRATSFIRQSSATKDRTTCSARRASAIAQAVDPRATATRSPVDDLKITYLVFPGTAEQPFGPPDLGHIRQRCQELLNDIGGNKADLHEWTSLLPPPPATPTPSPSPTTTSPVSPSPATGPSPSVTSAPGISPTPSPSATPAPIPAKPTPPPSASPTATPTRH